MSDTPTLFCFGLGYTASALVQRLRIQGWSIRGTSRSEAHCAALTDQDIAAWAFDRDRPLADPTAALAGVSHILSSVPPDAAGDPVIDCHGADIAALSARLFHSQAQPAWLAKVSPLPGTPAQSEWARSRPIHANIW